MTDDDKLLSYHLVSDVANVVANLEAWRCPDCNSRFGPITRLADQLISAELIHDGSCPWYQEATR